jgi:hypothetical protein
MTVATLAPIQFIVNPCPIAGAPAWDAACEEWVLVDTDGIRYCGSTPGDCYRQYGEALHYLAAHARKSRECSLEELRAHRTGLAT